VLVTNQAHLITTETGPAPDHQSRSATNEGHATTITMLRIAVPVPVADVDPARARRAIRAPLTASASADISALMNVVSIERSRSATRTPAGRAQSGQGRYC
jgi:hypothetical protein